MTDKDYEDTRQRHVADWLSAAGTVMAREAWTTDEVRAHQQRALRELVRQASERSHWHADRLRHLDPASLTLDDVASLPTMTKDDVVEHFADVVTDRRITRAAAEAHLNALDRDAYFLGDLHVVASGGSSGERAVFVYGWGAWIQVHLGLGRRIVGLFGQPDIGDGPITMGVVAAGNATHMTTAVAQTFRSPMVDTHSIPATLPLRDIVRQLNTLQPVVLIAYASLLGVLNREAEEGRLRISPRRIVTTSEPLLPEVRAAAEAVFGAPVANCWGTSEGGVLATGCWQSEGMHLNEDLVLVEPIDHDGRPVPPGELAPKVLITNLYNTTMPLIRYELTDEVTVLEEPCPCGASTSRIADVQGRTDDLFTYRGVTVHPHAIRSVLTRCSGIGGYQVVQTRGGIDVSVSAKDGFDEPGVTSALEAALTRVGLPNPTVHIHVTDQLPRHTGTGKLRRFVPLHEAQPVRATAPR